MKFSFSVPGVPVAKARHRTAILQRCKRCDRKLVGRQCRHCGSTELEAITTVASVDADAARYESHVRLFCQAEMGVQGIEPLKGPVKMTVVAYFRIAEGRLRGKHALHEGDPHCSRPDADNVLKAISDGLNTAAFDDDKQLAEITVSKKWAITPRAEITIESLVRTEQPELTLAESFHDARND